MYITPTTQSTAFALFCFGGKTVESYPWRFSLLPANPSNALKFIFYPESTCFAKGGPFRAFNLPLLLSAKQVQDVRLNIKEFANTSL